MRVSINLLFLKALLAVAGCETIQRAGRDLGTAGSQQVLDEK